ncbi:MAG: phosphoribosylformylglycinamidine synthase [Clostridia bacterium]
MAYQVRRIFVEKKKSFDVEAQGLFYDLRDNLGIKEIDTLRILNRYDVTGISEEEYQAARRTIFSEPPVDEIYDEEVCIGKSAKVFAIEYLPGQYDQRADSAAQCMQILTQGERPQVRAAKLIVLEGNIDDEQFQKIKEYCINPVEAHEASLKKPTSLDMDFIVPEQVDIVDGFIKMNEEQLLKLLKDMGFAMDMDDLKFCQQYFKDTEKRDPTITEMKMIDTYWSDHCRHTTFMTRIGSVEIESSPYSEVIDNVYHQYIESRKYVYGERKKDICLMDIATIGMKELKKQGKLNDLDESDEINACSIVVDVDVNGMNQEWLVMFKNETHNHPTEIEPFGGAATCLGGAIRDPLSGRTYVYQAMRVTGSGDPRIKMEDTIQGKLPQRKISTVAAAGYSSYGNQIGLATGQVAEIYDEGYVAKRLEIGAVVGAAPRKNIKREKPNAGDAVILLGGRTGRDGCGGATGSSKAHTEESLETCGAEVQKGNPPEERKIQRLFRNPKVTAMIKKCNDFGAGGISVAIGELADGLEINLDVVPKKYEGLDGTELAISESQERMAIIISKQDVQAFIEAARMENLEATEVAVVTEQQRLKMNWKGNTIVDVSREFLNSNGAPKTTDVIVEAPEDKQQFFTGLPRMVEQVLPDIKEAWMRNIQDLNVCSQKGLVERFDSTIGAGTVLMPFGGKYQLTPPEGMAAKIPVLDGDTQTGTVMTYGFNPKLSRWSPFHGAVYAVVEAVAKVAAMGGDYKKIRLTLQEYFERLGNDKGKWGKPFSALLGAYYAQTKLGIPAIGGKDSMSGTFKDLTVPPTLVAFALDIVNVNHVISPEFKKEDSKVVLIPLSIDEQQLPDFDQLDKNYSKIHDIIRQGKVLAAQSIRGGGIAEAVSKMCFGNQVGFHFGDGIDTKELFMPLYGSILLEIGKDENIDELLTGLNYKLLGDTQSKKTIRIGQNDIDLEQVVQRWQKPLENVFPTQTQKIEKQPQLHRYKGGTYSKASISFAKPRVFIPVFPGTNCEYDTAKTFEQAGGIVDTFVVRNLTAEEIEISLSEMVRRIKESQIIMIPGGFSGGDEPDGSGKFIATAFRNPAVKNAVMELLKNRDGLMLGICNGFQALMKLGLVPFGEIRDIDDDYPTLTFNTLGRHISCMAQTKVVSNLSPWFNNVKVGDVHSIAMSHGEGRFVASPSMIEKLSQNGQIATQYVDLSGKPTYDICFNPNGSMDAIEGITSPDGRVLGKMGHSERIGTNVVRNVPGDKDQKLFEAGIRYFK